MKSTIASLSYEKPISSKPPKPQSLLHQKEAPKLLSPSSKLSTPSSRHRKTFSWATPKSQSSLSPSKTRFDFTALDAASLDIRAYEASFHRHQQQLRRAKVLEKASEKEEWYKINSNIKKKLEQELNQHEGALINESSEMKRMTEEIERNKRNLEYKEKQEEMKAFLEAQARIKEEDLERERRRRSEEGVKAEEKKREAEEKRRRIREEKEEKRKIVMENFEIRRKMKEDERVREQRERQYELNQYALGLKAMMERQNY